MPGHNRSAANGVGKSGRIESGDEMTALTEVLTRLGDWCELILAGSALAIAAMATLLVALA